MVLDSWSNWNLKMLVFWGGRKMEAPGKKPSKKGSPGIKPNTVVRMLPEDGGDD
jgi:hypothetical protein